MKILLVNSLRGLRSHTFSEVRDVAGATAYTPNLAIQTLATLTPADVEVVLLDEAGYTSQWARMFRIAEEFRRRGQLVTIGGPFASLSPSSVRPHVDILFRGEAEHIWPEFLRQFRAGERQPEYHQRGPIDIEASPTPFRRVPRETSNMLRCWNMDILTSTRPRQAYRECPRAVGYLDTSSRRRSAADVAASHVSASSVPPSPDRCSRAQSQA
jgi:radical SAM superfamily enzyme YgiQ (UPF0313 family)